MAAHKGQINMGVKFDVDKSSLQQIKTDLSNIQKMTLQQFTIKNPDLGLNEARNQLISIKREAASLQSVLNKSFNTDLGTINLTKFDNELKKANLDLASIHKSFISLGSTGLAEWNKLSSAVLTSNLQLKQTHKILDNIGQTLVNSAKWGLASSVVNNMANSIQKAWDYTVKLDTSLNDIMIVTNKSAEQMEKFAVQANRAASQLGSSTRDYTNAALIYYQQGLDDAEAQARAEVTLKAANVTGQSGRDVSEQLTAIWNGYKVSAEEAELYIDKVAKVAASTAADLEEMATAMSKVASAANAAGVDIDHLNGMLATVISVTREAPETIGTSFRTIFARLGDLKLNGVDESGVELGTISGQLKELGIEILKENGDMRDMQDIIEDVAGKWENWTRAQQQAAAIAMAGQRQYSRLIALFDNWDMYTQSIEDSVNAQGELQKEQDTYMESTQAHLKQLSTAWDRVYDSAIDNGKANGVIDVLTGMTNALANLIEGLGGGGNALLAFGSIATQVFSKQIASGITSTINNFKIAEQNAQQLGLQLQQLKEINEASNWENNADKTRYEERLKMEEYIHTLTVDQIHEQEALIDKLAEAEGKLQELEAQQQEAAKIMMTTGPQDGSMSYEKSLAAVQNGNNTDNVDDQATYDRYLENSRAIQEQYNQVKETVKELTTTTQEYTNLLNDSNGDVEAQKEKQEELEAQLRDVTEQFEALKEETSGMPIAEVEKLNKVIDKLKKELKNIDFDKLGKDSTGKIENLENTLKDAGNAAAEFGNVFEQQVNKVTGAVNRTQQESSKLEGEIESLRVQLEGLKDMHSFENMMNGIVKTVGALGQLASGINAIQNLGSVWSNEDLTIWEKLAQTMFALSMIMPTVTAAFTTMKGVVQGVTLVNTLLTVATEAQTNAQKKQLLTEQLQKIQTDKSVASKTAKMILTKMGIITENADTAAITANTIAEAANTNGKKVGIIAGTAMIVKTMAQTVAKWALNAAEAAGAVLEGDGAKVALALAAAAVVATVAIASQAATQKAANEQAADAKEKNSELAESNDKVQESYKKLKDAFNAYDTAEEKLKSCIQGTEEWKQALEEVNEAAMNVIDNLPDGINVSGLYHRNSETGQIEFDKDKREQLEKDARKVSLSSDFAKQTGDYEARFATNKAEIAKNAQDMSYAAVNMTDALGVAGSSITAFATGPIGGLFGWIDVNNKEAEKATEVISEHAEEFAQAMDNTEFVERLKKYGIDMSSLSQNELTEYRNSLQQLSESTVAAAEKLRLLAGMKVDEILGNDYDAAEKKLTSDELVKEREEIYDEALKRMTGSGISKASGSGNKIYQEMAGRLEKATNGQYKAATGNTVLGTDGNRRFIFQDENGEKTEEKSAEWVASTIAAYEALDKVNKNAERAKKNLENLDNQLEDTFGKELGESLSTGLRNYIANGNLDTLTQEEYQALAGMDPEELKKAMGFKEGIWGDIEFKNTFGKSYSEFQDTLKGYEKSLEDFVKELIPTVQDAFNGLDNMDKLTLAGKKAVAQALEGAMVGGGEESLNKMKSIFSKMSEDEMKTFVDATGKISDWGSMTSVELEKVLKDAGVTTEFTNKELEDYVDIMRQAGNSTKDFTSLAEQYAKAMDIAKDKKLGDTISEEDYKTLGAAAQGYFTKMLDGTYKLTKDASDFYDAIKANQVEKFKNSLQDQKKSLDSLKSIQSANFDTEKLSTVQGASHKINDRLYDMGYDLYGGYSWITRQENTAQSRSSLSNEQKQEKGLSWKDDQGLQAQIDLMKVLGDTEKALKLEDKMFKDQLTNTDYKELAESTKNLTDQYGGLTEAIKAAGGAYYENWLSLLTSAKDLDEMNSLVDRDDVTSMAAFTEAYNQMREAQRMDDLDVDAMEDYAKHLQEIAKGSNKLSDELTDNEERAEDLATQIMNMTKGVDKLAKGWEDWSDILKKSSKESEEYFTAMSGVKDAMSDLLDIDKEYISDDFVVKHMDDIAKAAKGDADAIDRLRAASLESVLVSIDFKDDDIKNRFTETIQSLQDIANNSKVEILPGMDLTNIENGAQQYIDDLNQMIEAGEITAADVNAALSAIGYSPVYEEEEIQVPQRQAVTTTHHQVIHKGTQTINGNEVEEWDDKAWTETSYLDDESEYGVFGLGSEENPPTITGHKLAGLSKKAGGQFNNYSSSNSGGPSAGGKKSGGNNKPSKEKPIDKEKDRYHDVNIKLKQISTTMDRLEKQSDKLFGKDLIDNLNKQLSTLDKQISVTNEKIKIAEGEATELQGKLSGQGVKFNADGTIANYAAAYDAQLNYVNSLIAKYNSMDKEAQENFKETLDNAKENFNKFVEDMGRYDELITEEIPEMQDQIQEAIDKQIEINIQKFNMEIDIRLNMAEAERDWNQFKKKIIDGIKDTDILGNAKARLQDFNSYYKADGTGVIQRNQEHVNDILGELRLMDQGKKSSVYGDNRTAALEDLEKYYKQLMSDLEDVQDLEDEIHEDYLDKIDEVNDKFAEQIDMYEQVSNIINHDMKVIQLIGGDKQYAALREYYQMQEDNYNKSLEFQRQQVDFWKEQMDLAEEGSDEWKKYKENWVDAINTWQSTIEDSLENIRDKFENTINDIFDRLNNKVTNGMGLDYVNEEWELINKNADQYLDTINSMYGIRDLQNKYQDAIDNTDSVSAQRKLNALMEQEVNALKEKDKLTQYDVERAEKKYQIALAQIALEEAQQNKSNMRLRRDSQGNYTYQFTADEDAVGKAQDELSALQNELYNFDLERYRDNLDQIYEAWEEYQEKMAEAAMINDPEERAEREVLLHEQYGDLINGLVEQNETVRLNLHESAFTELADLYGIDLENFQSLSDDEQDVLLNDMIPQWDSGVQQMADKFAGEGGFIPTCKDAMDELAEATKEYEGDLKQVQEAGGFSYETILGGTDETITATQDLIVDNNELIGTYGAELSAVQAVVAELGVLTSSYKSAKTAAMEAADAAYRYWAMANGDAAAAARGLGGSGSGSGNNNTNNNNNNSGGGNSGGNGGGSGTGDGNMNVGDTATYSGKYYYDSYGSSPTGSKYSGVANGIVIDRITSNPYGIHIHSADGKYGDLGWVKKSQLSGYDTGGYTGQWAGGDGKLALLHSKELVLNAEDTRNILDAVEIIRNINNAMLTNIANMVAGTSAPQASVAAMQVEQDVHIDATFPNVVDSNEIEQAFNNLINIAAQRSYKG